VRLKTSSETKTLQWIYYAKGISILLVVIAHFYPESSPGYWVELRNIIASFVMQLFFILSGFLYKHNKYAYFDLLKIKANRLLFPFISVAAVFFLFKYLAGNIFHIENPLDIRSVYALILDPTYSFMPLLWFIHALFIIFVLYPLVRFFLNNILVFLFFIAANSFLGSDFIVLGDTVYFMPFFVLGVIIKDHKSFSEKLFGASWLHVLLPVVIFTLFYYARAFIVIEYWLTYLFEFVLAVTGSLFVINLSHVLNSFELKKVNRILFEIGYYTLTIYLFHTLFVSGVRIAFLQGIDFIQIPFEVIAIIATFCGVFFPMELERRLLRKYSITRRLFLGIS